MDAFRAKSEDFLTMIKKNQAASLAVAGAVTGIVSYGATEYYKDHMKKTGDATGLKRLHQSEIAMTVGLTLLGSALVLGGIDYMKR